jgi:hypothetical protein
MSTKQKIEIILMLGCAVLGVVGSALIEPAVIGAGVVVAGAIAVIRFNDQRSALDAKRMSSKAVS